MCFCEREAESQQTAREAVVNMALEGSLDRDLPAYRTGWRGRRGFLSKKAACSLFLLYLGNKTLVFIIYKQTRKHLTSCEVLGSFQTSKGVCHCLSCKPLCHGTLLQISNTSSQPTSQGLPLAFTSPVNLCRGTTVLSLPKSVLPEVLLTRHSDCSSTVCHF